MSRFLARAEQALKAGKYYHASGLYELARAVDPSNPVPVFGRAVALLAAGDYMSSVTQLFEAIQLADQTSADPIDFKTFLPDPGVLDTRRAELENRLSLIDDYRLRFLLGFAEYVGGLSEVGLVDMDKGVSAAPVIIAPGKAQFIERDAQLRQQLRDQIAVLEQEPPSESRQARKARNQAIEEKRLLLAEQEQKPVYIPGEYLDVTAVRRFVDRLRSSTGPPKPVPVPNKK